MTAHDQSFPTPAAGLPRILHTELDGPIIPTRSWVWTIAPAYAGLFAAMPMLDRLGTYLVGTSTEGSRSQPSLGGAIAMAIAGVLACLLLVHDPLANWGLRSRRRLVVTSASSFGVQGAEWLTGVLVAIGALISYALSLHVSIRFVILGLIHCGLVQSDDILPWKIGPVTLESPPFVLSAGFWIFIVGMTSVLRIASVIFALMQVYTPVALVLLGLTCLLTSDGLPLYLKCTDSLPGFEPGPLSTWVTGRPELFQLVFAAFALPGLFSVDWGSMARSRGDIRLGGWVGVLLAGAFATTMSLVTVAGTLGTVECAQTELFPAVEVLTVPFSYHWAIIHGIGGRTGGAILMLFGMASLASGCYACSIMTQRLSTHWPSVGHNRWTWFGSLPVLLLVVTSLAGDLEAGFRVLGALFAPVAGVMVADAVRNRFRWQGVVEGWNADGIIAWACGVAVGFGLSRRFEPAAFWAYLVAMMTYLLLGAVVPRGKVDPRLLAGATDGRRTSPGEEMAPPRSVDA